MSAEDRGRRIQKALADKDRASYYNGLAHLLSSADGRRFVWLFSLSLGYDTDTFTGENNATNYALGRKAAAEELLRTIRDEHNDAYQLMLKELHNVHQTRMGQAERSRDLDATEFRSVTEPYTAGDGYEAS